ncbi:TetR/AcrR family transcriptional regulator [Rhizobium sp. K1/93]|uniref:TetR/AcrR family transcriptional regulator n=4 Tax=Rhizobium TaxID=379 RepID=UPI001AD9D253|nr:MULTISPECIES: TetR/AcrR family transcriptional regulator [unclassified Rhizobium]MBO9187044.1 TetR/AcrR family transcriptional regulator [Rhizobium sp. E27B/91]QXZ86126.1 TetR/AcrR family transcriptional regulator [Rhizobium sp. K1/93]QXZ92418.1 TetR/AcrR family transcriptional regulator [Rhizobium sp. K15/93]QYA04361.1 TetR/AcrR family transcriptional regulator [Rhizobium sp. B21/90]
MSIEETDNGMAGPPRGRRGRPRVFSENERRKAILGAAQEAFVELGFSRTTTQVVAAKAKVSKRSIYEVFTDKTAMFAEVIRNEGAIFLDLPRPSREQLPLLDTLVRIFRLDIDEAAELRREALLHLIMRESLQFPELSDYLYDNGIIRAREDLIEWLRSQNEADRLTIEDPAVCSGMLMDIVFGALLPRRRLKAAADRELRKLHIKKRLEIFLNGVRRA